MVDNKTSKMARTLNDKIDEFATDKDTKIFCMLSIVILVTVGFIKLIELGVF